MAQKTGLKLTATILAESTSLMASRRVISLSFKLNVLLFHGKSHFAVVKNVVNFPPQLMTGM